MSRGGSDARRRTRSRQPRPLRRRGLVVSEGTNTEVQYVDRLKQLLRDAQTDSVGVTTKGVGRDPLSVLRKAVEFRDQAEADGEPYDWSFVIVDVDRHTTLATCLKVAQAKGIGVIVCNPSFEVWLLWHFDECRGYSSQAELAARLAVRGIHDKNLPAGFPIASYQLAMGRAMAADPDNAVGRRGPNPSSAMPALVTSMMAG